MKSKGQLYIYIYQVFNKHNLKSFNLTQVYYSLQIKYYKAPGLALSSDSGSIEKSYRETK
jgi:hypothetical protein